MAQHTAAIHVLKAKCALSDEDYRALLRGLTGKASSKDMTADQQQHVRQHLQRLAQQLGAAPAATRRRPLSDAAFAKAKLSATPKERKVWALWNQLGRDGVLHNPSRAALNAWVQRTVHVSAPRFCTSAQLDTLIEALKAWQERGSA